MNLTIVNHNKNNTFCQTKKFKEIKTNWLVASNELISISNQDHLG